MSKYVIGLDFGTLSGRALVVDVETGRECASAVMEYPHGVLSEKLPDGTPLPPDFALQDPEDYIQCLRFIVPEAMRRANVTADEVIGLGLDFTSSTFLPVDETLVPLCLKAEFVSEPHAWVKIWKHHAANREAELMTQSANAEQLKRFGGKVSSEWMIPKLWETIRKAPAVAEGAYTFIEAGDWLIGLMTGSRKRSATMAGFKAFWDWDKGFATDWFRAIDPKLADVVENKLDFPYVPIGSEAGKIDLSGSVLTGLKIGTPVAVANIDAYVALPAANIVSTGAMMMIIGTSGCHLMLGDTDVSVPGMCGSFKNGMMPGSISYESGQSCMGDHFAWFTERCCPAEYAHQAKERNMNLHQYLTMLAQKEKPGAGGLIALDWWNGNRSVLVDYDLSGMILGLTLATRAEEIYRALIEATAYGARMIVDTFEKYGVPIRELCASGGIAKKNRLLMQIFADVLNRPIRVTASDQIGALGSAMFGAVAAGEANGGYDTIQVAAAKMCSPDICVFEPIPENVKIYEQLYREYELLHDYFGRGENNVMKRLRRLREAQC